MAIDQDLITAIGGADLAPPVPARQTPMDVDDGLTLDEDRMFREQAQQPPIPMRANNLDRVNAAIANDTLQPGFFPGASDMDWLVSLAEENSAQELVTQLQDPMAYAELGPGTMAALLLTFERDRERVRLRNMTQTERNFLLDGMNLDDKGRQHREFGPMSLRPDLIVPQRGIGFKPEPIKGLTQFLGALMRTPAGRQAEPALAALEAVERRSQQTLGESQGQNPLINEALKFGGLGLFLPPWLKEKLNADYVPGAPEEQLTAQTEYQVAAIERELDGTGGVAWMDQTFGGRYGDQPNLRAAALQSYMELGQATSALIEELYNTDPDMPDDVVDSQAAEFHATGLQNIDDAIGNQGKQLASTFVADPLNIFELVMPVFGGIVSGAQAARRAGTTLRKHVRTPQEIHRAAKHYDHSLKLVATQRMTLKERGGTVGPTPGEGPPGEVLGYRLHADALISEGLDYPGGTPTSGVEQTIDIAVDGFVTDSALSGAPRPGQVRVVTPGAPGLEGHRLGVAADMDPAQRVVPLSPEDVDTATRLALSNQSIAIPSERNPGASIESLTMLGGSSGRTGLPAALSNGAYAESWQSVKNVETGGVGRFVRDLLPKNPLGTKASDMQGAILYKDNVTGEVIAFEVGGEARINPRYVNTDTMDMEYGRLHQQGHEGTMLMEPHGQGFDGIPGIDMPGLEAEQLRQGNVLQPHPQHLPGKPPDTRRTSYARAHEFPLEPEGRILMGRENWSKDEALKYWIDLDAPDFKDLRHELNNVNLWGKTEADGAPQYLIRKEYVIPDEYGNPAYTMTQGPSAQGREIFKAGAFAGDYGRVVETFVGNQNVTLVPLAEAERILQSPLVSGPVDPADMAQQRHGLPDHPRDWLSGTTHRFNPDNATLWDELQLFTQADSPARQRPGNAGAAWEEGIRPHDLAIPLKDMNEEAQKRLIPMQDYVTEFFDPQRHARLRGKKDRIADPLPAKSELAKAETHGDMLEGWMYPTIIRGDDGGLWVPMLNDGAQGHHASQMAQAIIALALNDAHRPTHFGKSLTGQGAKTIEVMLRRYARQSLRKAEAAGLGDTLEANMLRELMQADLFPPHLTFTPDEQGRIIQAGTSPMPAAPPGTLPGGQLDPRAAREQEFTAEVNKMTPEEQDDFLQSTFPEGGY